ncbi:hypothetical protein B0H17DRAFT_1201361 [Mycena rosella]|uniref:Uncharacterized protein n=1 Tax=Mycena rosella TaxID=1033263 RepID=A0AAD7GIT4_MYCRO|nr:hypothetical protein B0H17DRAFT_1201361 [Mycena rosella]
MGRTTPTPGRRISRSPTPVSYEENVLMLDFVCRRNSRSILNCTVVGRGACTPYFHIMTSADVRPGETIFRTNIGRTIAAVEWRGAGGAPYRTMDVRGQRYVWVPQDNAICMYSWNSGSSAVPQLLARLEKVDNTATLEITLDAVDL